jgi:hypothetical protein
MTIKHNDIEYTFSVRNHEGKFSQSKQKHVGKYKDLDCSYDGQFASVTAGLKPGKDGDVPETNLDVAKRLLERIPYLDPKDVDLKAVAALLA